MILFCSKKWFAVWEQSMGALLLPFLNFQTFEINFHEMPLAELFTLMNVLLTTVVQKSQVELLSMFHDGVFTGI